MASINFDMIVYFAFRVVENNSPSSIVLVDSYWNFMKDNLREVKVNFVLLNVKLLQQKTAFSLEADF